MDEKTGRKYRDSSELPSERSSPRTYRTRQDPFADVWAEVESRLEREPKLRAVTLFDWLQDQYPGRFSESQRRTLERRVRRWRGVYGPGKSVMFPQVHHAGDLSASDFTYMNALHVTIAGQPYDHMLYHFVLTFSNWESVSICHSESFEALSRGLQEALWKVGGVPRRHRSDSLSAAVNNLSEDREFRGRYTDLMNHYQIEPQRTNAHQAHENGDVESSHGHLKTVIDQALLLRGSRDFADREAYQQFLTQLIDKRNAARADKLGLEEACLAELPLGKLQHQQWCKYIRVASSCTIQVKRNTYSVPSRLIGHKVDVMIDADEIEVWFAGNLVQRMPRLSGKDKHAINYRHVIDSLVRKPGAFEHYKYHEDLFPTSHFRMAYDELCLAHTPRVAAREYLKILQLAARDSEDAVNSALRLAIASNTAITCELIRSAIEAHQQLPAPTELNIETPDLNDFDSLLHNLDMEVEPNEYDDSQAAYETEPGSREDRQPDTPPTEIQPRADRTVSGVASADVPRAIRGSSGTCDARNAQSYGVPFGTDRPGVSGTEGESHCAVDATVATPDFQDLGKLRLEATADPSRPPAGDTPRRLLPGPPRESAPVRETGLGKEPLSFRTGGATRATRPIGVIHDLQSAGAAVVGSQAGFTTC
jgi:hypothetical protein